MGGASVSQTGVKIGQYVQCRSCKWTQEGPYTSKKCPRCLARSVQSLSLPQFLALFDSGDVAFCEACQSVHGRY